MKFKDKKVTIMGLGLLEGGVGTAKFFCQQGAKVLITDLKTKEQLKESVQKLKGFSIEYVLGRHRVRDFTEPDLVIKNPAVPNDSPYLGFARQYNVPIESDISIFFKLSKAPIIGVTGTKGKSTVSTIIYLLLKSKYPKTILAGNIGVSPLEYLSKITPKTKVVLEISSFALETLKKSPEIAVITNVFPDHLDRYNNFQEYITAKKRIFAFQRKKDILVLNYDDVQTRSFFVNALSRVYFFSKGKTPAKSQQKRFGCFLKGKNILFNQGKDYICDIKNLKLEGEDNLSNVLAAVSIAKILKVPEENIKKVLEDFKGVSDRQEFIKEINGIKYFNDTTATTPQSTIAAIKSLPDSKIVLIAGGQDKNLNYKNLAKEIKKRVDCLVLLPGTASNKIKKELRALNSSVQIIHTNSMGKAVSRATKKAEDIVLLSPGAASFNLFKNEFDRGEQFKKAVKKIT